MLQLHCSLVPTGALAAERTTKYVRSAVAAVVPPTNYRYRYLWPPAAAAVIWQCVAQHVSVFTGHSRLLLLAPIHLSVWFHLNAAIGFEFEFEFEFQFESAVRERTEAVRAIHAPTHKSIGLKR